MFGSLTESSYNSLANILCLSPSVNCQITTTKSPLTYREQRNKNLCNDTNITLFLHSVICLKNQQNRMLNKWGIAIQERSAGLSWSWMTHSVLLGLQPPHIISLRPRHRLKLNEWKDAQSDECMETWPVWDVGCGATTTWGSLHLCYYTRLLFCTVLKFTCI